MPANGYAGDANHRYVFYDFRPSRSRDGPREVLGDYHGYLQTDGYIVYTSLVREAAGRLVDVACRALGRIYRLLIAIGGWPRCPTFRSGFDQNFTI
jgi:hypothetical protein